jgi:hypothetical protein
MRSGRTANRRCKAPLRATAVIQVIREGAEKFSGRDPEEADVQYEEIR